MQETSFHKSGCTMDLPQCQETQRASNDFLFILLQVPFCSNRWSAPGQYLRTNVNLSFKARCAEQEKQV